MDNTALWDKRRYKGARLIIRKESTLRLQRIFCSIVIPWSELMNFIDHIVIPSKTNVVAKKARDNDGKSRRYM